MFFASRQDVPVIEAPVEVEDDNARAADENYCNQYASENCPAECVVCPPCEVCSSIQCRAEASCSAMGFDKNWYKENVLSAGGEPIVDIHIDGTDGYIKDDTGADKDNNQEINAGMANPASVYCVQQGGELEIREGEGGQYGVCIFPDGRECDEWEFFRTKVCGDPNVDNGDADDQVCGRENCHGLDIKCGPNVAEICTEIYQLGDKCLRYVNCGIVNGVCRQIPNAAFDACKICAQKCETDFAGDSMKLFDCESKCN